MMKAGCDRRVRAAFLAVMLVSSGSSFVVAEPASERHVSATPDDTLAAREEAVWQAMLADEAHRAAVNNPMTVFAGQWMMKRGREREGLAIISAGIANIRAFIEHRESIRHPNIGGNGFNYWALLDAYANEHGRFDQKTLDDYRYVFTHAKNYKGTTSNLGMIHTLALLFADNIWGAENLPADAKTGARGPEAIHWLGDRIEHVARRGAPEFASRPYTVYNCGTLLTLDSEYVPEELRRKARIAYEVWVAHAAGTWLRGHWATPSGRTYPDMLTQQPTGGAALLWLYFGGVHPKLDARSQAIFAAVKRFRPPAAIVAAATDRSKPYVHRSRFDGARQFQTTFMNRTYAVYSTAVLPGSFLWGQTYPFGVMWEEPDTTKTSQLWITVPASDGKPLGQATHGINSRRVQYAQHEGSLLLVADGIAQADRFPYVLGFIPGGARAVVNESETAGRIFLHYESVLISIVATKAFSWDPTQPLLCGTGRPGDSEFRIRGEHAAVAIETATVDEFPGPNASDQLAAFRTAVLVRSKIKAARRDGSADLTATFTDRTGATIEKTFEGATTIDGRAVDYTSWPLVDNPWMHQPWGGNLTVTDGATQRVYDLDRWLITETAVAP